MSKLPPGWTVAKLPDIASIIMGQSPPSTTYNTEGKGLPFFQGKAEFGDLFPTPVKYCSQPAKIAEPGDILISVRAPVGPTNLCKVKSCIGRGLAAIRLRDGIPSKYLLYYLRSIEQWLSNQGTGSTFTAISKSDLEHLDLPLAPLAEQRRIVAKLEVLLSKIDSCKDRLAKIPIILKRFRQSVLAAACSGRLTADWRDRHPVRQAADVIMEAVQEELERSARSATQKARLQQIFAIREENDSADLPRGWQFVALHKLCYSFDYGTSAKSHPSGKVPVLRMGNIQGGRIDWTDLAFTSDSHEIEKYLLQSRTVLFNRTNSPELVGKTAIYRGERPAIFAGYLIRINPVPQLDPEYLNLCLNTAYAREFCTRVKSDGVSQSNINAQKLGMFEVPFCSLPEQQEIVRRAEALLRFADRIETRFVRASEQVRNLVPSLLTTAFRGELVATEADLITTDGRKLESTEGLLADTSRSSELSPDQVQSSRWVRSTKVITKRRSASSSGVRR